MKTITEQLLKKTTKSVNRLIIVLMVLCFFTNVNAQWANQNAGFTNKTLGFYEFSIVNENVVWAICYDGIGGLFGSNPILDFTRTTNGGTTWTAGLMGSDTSLAFSNISAISDTEAWVAMHKFNFSGGGGLFHTVDGGITWTQSNAGLIFNDNSFPNFVYFKDALNGIAGGDANDGYFEIYKTNNGGTTWTRTPQTNIPNFISGGGFGWFDGYAVVGNTVWFGTSAGQIYKSTDFGTTWTVSTMSAAQETVYEIAFNDDGLHGISHVRNNTSTKLFSTTDGGTTWAQIPTNTIPNWKQSRICSVPGTNIFVSTSVNGGVNRGSSYTTNNGTTWTLIEATKQKAACRFLNSTTGWSGGFFNDNPLYAVGDGIFKWDNTTTLSTDSYNFKNSNVKIYPNPALNEITISFSEILNPDVKVKIIDLLGRTSFSGNYENTITNDIKIDVSNFEKGNYIIKIESNDEYVTKKIIVE
ncbi:T9SS type A sorting domain-containing protein [Flavobacterium sp.]|uniref:T9SS type A sorting domain-containing protein n=1 Tax=Flavobacterium sp. TaxID=239 RepID=UPI00286AEA8B|nr:T9SS type A sorting domain-containing protein [Flavobacterium sp.]